MALEDFKLNVSKELIRLVTKVESGLSAYHGIKKECYTFFSPYFPDIDPNYIAGTRADLFSKPH
jgi:hypothetical protein